MDLNLKIPLTVDGIEYWRFLRRDVGEWVRLYIISSDPDPDIEYIGIYDTRDSVWIRTANPL
jgi:hypothetical protein